MISRQPGRIRGANAADVAAATLVVLLVALVLAPAFARLQRSSAEARCQSNLRRWAQATSLYLTDHNNGYPSNLQRPAVRLTTDGLTDSQGNPRLFDSGPNWVEALYPYLWSLASRTSEDWKSFRACPKASVRAPADPSTAYMTYAINYNLLEKKQSQLRTANQLMMLREMDVHVNAVTRPCNLSSSATTTPKDAFLTATDSSFTGTTMNPSLHGSGSYIAFADGHVRYFTAAYYPTTPAYDSATQRWYNFVYANPSNDEERALNKSIAITP